MTVTSISTYWGAPKWPPRPPIRSWRPREAVAPPDSRSTPAPSAPVPQRLIPQRLAAGNLAHLGHVRIDDVLERDVHELVLGEPDVLEEDVQTGRPLAVVLVDEGDGLLGREAPVAKVDGHQVGRPSEAPLEELQIVADPLHGALDLLVAVLGGHALHALLLPVELAADQLGLGAHVPGDETAQAHGAEVQGAQVTQIGIGEGLEVAPGDGAVEHAVHVLGGDPEVHEAVEALLVDLLACS